MQVTTSRDENEGARTLTLDWALLDKDAVAIEKELTKEVSDSHLKGSLKIAFQGVVRRLLKADKNDKEIIEHMKSWKPGIRKEGKSPVEKAKDAYSKLSPEEKKALLAELRGAK